MHVLPPLRADLCTCYMCHVAQLAAEQEESEATIAAEREAAASLEEQVPPAPARTAHTLPHSRCG